MFKTLTRGSHMSVTPVQTNRYVVGKQREGRRSRRRWNSDEGCGQGEASDRVVELQGGVCYRLHRDQQVFMPVLSVGRS
jgi:hypothetical protein